jgi:hypothetical protein
VLNGQLSLSEEQALVQRARTWIETAPSENPALTEYLANFQHWREIADDDDPFLAASAPATPR